jgi:hypothetical protein
MYQRKLKAVRMKKFLLFGLLLAGFGLAGCEFNQLAGDEQVDELMLVPKQQTQQKAKTNSNQQTSPYSCLISTLAEDEADYNYWNQAFWVHFPRSAIDEAEGKTIFKAFSFASEQSGDNAGSWAGKGKIVRLAQCEIPDSDFAETLLIEQFIKFDEKLVDVFNRQLKSKAGDWECIEFYHTYDCEYDPSEGMVICTIMDTHCVTWVYVEEPPISGGGGGFPGNDPGECDPMGTEPCFDGGGGSSIPPPEPDPCDETNPPSWCTDKCETGDATIDNTGVQETFEYLYDKSDFDLPIDQRTEQGGWITKDPLSGDFGFTEFPSNWPRYACGIGMPQNWVNAAPSNTVGMVHTHPFFENDDTTDPNVCGEEYGTEDWTSGFGNDDLQALIDLANHLSDHTIKGYVIDGNNIVTFNTLSFTGPEDIDPRCGY